MMSLSLYETWGIKIIINYITLDTYIIDSFDSK
jgi:hypothetical protein